jgi:hypothetical protein
MLEHRRTLFVVLFAAIVIGGCGDSRAPILSPVVPTPAPKPTLPTQGSAGALSSFDERWTLTTVLTGVTGQACSGDPPIRTKQSGEMAAARTDAGVRFLYWVSNYPTDDVRYSVLPAATSSRQRPMCGRSRFHRASAKERSRGESLADFQRTAII